MSGDTLTDISLFDLMDFHNQSNSTLTVLMKKEDLEQGKKLGKAPLSCNLTETYDICLINPNDSAIAYMTNSDELVDGEFSVKRPLLLRYSITADSRHPVLELMTNLFDTHVYVCKNVVLEVLDACSKLQGTEITNFKDDFLRFFVANQYHQ